MLRKEPNIVVTCNIIAHLEGLCWQRCFKNFLMPPPTSRDLPRNCKGRMESQEVLYDMQENYVCSQIYSPGIKANLLAGRQAGGHLAFLLQARESLRTLHLGQRANSTLDNSGLKTINSL